MPQYVVINQTRQGNLAVTVIEAPSGKEAVEMRQRKLDPSGPGVVMVSERSPGPSGVWLRDVIRKEKVTHVTEIGGIVNRGEAE